MSRLDPVLPYLKASLDDEHAGRSVKLSSGDTPVLRRFVGRLLVSYVIDNGDSFTYVQERDVVDAGITHDALHARAVANLTQLTNERGMQVHAMENCVAVMFDGNFEATLMLVPELWTYLRKTYGDELFVAAPARDVLAVARGGGEVAELRAVVDRIWPDGDHLLTRDIFGLRGDTWDLLADA